MSNGSGAHDKRDYYEVLGLDRNATSDDIKRAFRSLARNSTRIKILMTPTRSQNSKVQEAYAILSNPDEKSKYDRYGHNRPGGNPFGPDGFQGVDINIEDLFGGGFEYFGVFSEVVGLGVLRGSDLLYRHSISFEEAFSGLDADIDIEVMSFASRVMAQEPDSDDVDVCATCGAMADSEGCRELAHLPNK